MGEGRGHPTILAYSTEHRLKKYKRLSFMRLLWAIFKEFKVALAVILCVVLGGGSVMHLGKGLAFSDAMVAAFAASFFEIVVDPPFPWYLQIFLYIAPVMGLFVITDSIVNMLLILLGAAVSGGSALALQKVGFEKHGIPWTTIFLAIPLSSALGVATGAQMMGAYDSWSRNFLFALGGAYIGPLAASSGFSLSSTQCGGDSACEASELGFALTFAALSAPVTAVVGQEFGTWLSDKDVISVDVVSFAPIVGPNRDLVGVLSQFGWNF